VLRFFLPPRQDITSLTYPDGFVNRKQFGYARLGKMDFQQPICAEKKCFRFIPSLENIIIHGGVAFDAARFRILPVLSKEKSIR